MARKRPRLIPVWDSVIKGAFGLTRPGVQWKNWHQMLSADDNRLHHDMLKLRQEAGLTDEISALRVLDVVVWMEHGGPADDNDEGAELVG